MTATERRAADDCQLGQGQGNSRMRGIVPFLIFPGPAPQKLPFSHSEALWSVTCRARTDGPV